MKPDLNNKELAIENDKLKSKNKEIIDEYHLGILTGVLLGIFIGFMFAYFILK